MLTPMDCQAAPARLHLTRERLAPEAGVTGANVMAFELEQRPAEARLIAALTGALEPARRLPTGTPGPNAGQNGPDW